MEDPDLHESFLDSDDELRDVGGARYQVPQEEDSACLNRIASVIRRCRFCIVAFWLAMLVIGLTFGPKFLTQANDKVVAPPGSDAAIGLEAFQQRFRHKAEEMPVLLLIQCRDGHENEMCDVRHDDGLRAFYHALKREVLAYNETNNNVLDIMGYFDFAGTLLDGVKEGFISKDHRDTFVNIFVREGNLTKVRNEFIDWLNDFFQRSGIDEERFVVGLSGFDAIAMENIQKTKEQLMRIDTVSVPFAFLVLTFMIRSWRLLVIVLLNVGTSILFSFAIMSLSIDYLGAPLPESATGQLMEVMCLAMSIDYSLFFLRRFRDEVARDEASVDRCVCNALRHAGHVILLSGTTIMVVFLGFLLLPSDVLRMDGTSCALGIAICMLVALTNTPALLFAFPGFFSNFNNNCCRCDKRYEGDDGYILAGSTVDTSEASTSSDGELSIGTPPLVPTRQRREEPKMKRTLRFRLTARITTYPYNLMSILGLFLLVIPLAIQVKDISINQDILTCSSRTAQSTQVMKSMYTEFPGGLFSPFYVLIEAEEDERSIFHKDLFESAYRISQRIVADTECSKDAVTSPASLKGFKITPLMARILLYLANDFHGCQPKNVRFLWKRDCSLAKEYAYLVANSVNEESNAMLINVIVPFFPFEEKSKYFIDKVNKILDEERGSVGKSSAHEQEAEFRFESNIVEAIPTKVKEEFQKSVGKLSSMELEYHLVGFEVGFDALMRHVFALFPTLIVSTVAVVFVVIAVFLKSYFVPLRLALTLLLPLAAVYGAAVLVYEKGALNFLGIAALSEQGGFFWYVPLLVTTIVIGLALDYDVFLVLRIMEYRKKQYNIQAAIVKAVCDTGGTIGAAGIIMLLVFGGMLLSDQGTVNQVGFLLASAVFVDTFIINTILVPAIMSIGDRLAWAPTKMPQLNLRDIDSL